MFRILAAALVAVIVALSAGTALAQTWLRAESENFIVYSSGSERDLRAYVTKLERFDQILRFRFNVPADRPILRKLPIYLVSGHSGLSAVRPDIPEMVAGFYTASEEDIFAVATRSDGDQTLLHEYAHHFFYQHLNAPYPGWLTEGLAEYVMTVRIRNDDFVLGEMSPARVSWLEAGHWLPLDQLLGKRFSQIEGGQNRATYYPVAGLLTHWFFSTPERSAQLDAYLRLVASGVGPSEAITQATGMTIPQLTATLTGYARGNVYAGVYDLEYRDVDVEITRMPDSARDLILLGQQIKIGGTEEQRAAALADIKARAARWPDDPFALLILGHAELHQGDAAAGEAALLRVLELDPENDEALQYLATGRIRAAGDTEDAEQKRVLLAQARGFLSRAYSIDPDDYFTLLLITRTRQGQPGYPNDNDMLTWEAAFDGAPQLPGIRLGYGHALIAAGRRGEAVMVLIPVANSPHGGTAAEEARALMAQALGETPPEPDPGADVEPGAEAGSEPAPTEADPSAADQAG